MCIDFDMLFLVFAVLNANFISGSLLKDGVHSQGEDPQTSKSAAVKQKGESIQEIATFLHSTLISNFNSLVGFVPITASDQNEQRDDEIIGALFNSFFPSTVTTHPSFKH